jgi:hypothetical protein
VVELKDRFSRFSWQLIIYPQKAANMKTANCPKHGEKGIGLVCKHVAFALVQGKRVGFYWGDDTDTARADAWCSECEKALVALNGASSEDWFIKGEFKILCAACWD